MRLLADTHFIFVDDTKRKSADAPAWGKEVALRSAVEDIYANTLNIPMLLLVVDGGPGTLDTVFHFASQAVKKPIVVVHDSGRAATAIYDFCTQGESAALPQAFQSSKAIDQLEKIRQANEDCSERLLTFVSSQEDLTSR